MAPLWVLEAQLMLMMYSKTPSSFTSMITTVKKAYAFTCMILLHLHACTGLAPSGVGKSIICYQVVGLVRNGKKYDLLPRFWSWSVRNGKKYDLLPRF